jgi:hypothetical protein
LVGEPQCEAIAITADRDQLQVNATAHQINHSV